MSSYILVLIWVGIVAILMANTEKKPELICGQIEYRAPMWIAIVAIIPLIYWAGTRGYIGDTYAYVRNFNNAPDTIEELETYYLTLQKDKAFYCTTALIHIFVTKNHVIFLSIMAGFQLFSLIRIFRRYSENLAVSLFLFVASTDYISWVFNGMRQFTATTISLFAFKYIVEKKYVRAIIIVFIASLFHKSALFIIPFVFVTQGKAWNKKSVIFLLGAILAVSMVNQFTNIMEESLSNTQYSNVVSDYKGMGDDGTNPLRALVYCVPTIISFWKRREIQQRDDTVINICVNMSIVAAGIYLISVFTSGIFLGRVPIYFSLYNYILLVWEIEYLFDDTEKKIVLYGMVTSYLLFYYYQMFIQWGG